MRLLSTRPKKQTSLASDRASPACRWPWELVRAGKDVVVLDRGPIGKGTTSCTTAHLTAQCDDGFHRPARAQSCAAASPKSPPIATRRASFTYVPRCPHLGRYVHWNSFERCWDCPCHGSPLAPDGTALNGPAFSALEEIKP